MGKIADSTAFKVEGTVLVKYIEHIEEEEVTEAVIPDGVTEIEKYAFYHCVNLTSVTIPDSVTTIHIDAFCHCLSLESITIPNSDESAYVLCHNGNKIPLPVGLVEVSESILSDAAILKIKK